MEIFMDILSIKYLCNMINKVLDVNFLKVGVKVTIEQLSFRGITMKPIADKLLGIASFNTGSTVVTRELQDR